MDKPIIFSGPMVRALLDGRKTMTRRLAWGANGWFVPQPSPWQKVKPGDRLWVKESHWRLGRWMHRLGSDDKPHWEFLPENETPDSVMFERPAAAFIREHRTHDDLAWWLRPSIFHPKALGRITLIVTATKVERLKEISHDDAIAEGLTEKQYELGGRYGLPNWSRGLDAPGKAFAHLWDYVHYVGAWDANPEVVALTFRVIRENIDQIAA